MKLTAWLSPFALAICVSLGYVYFLNNKQASEITMATGEKGGLYHQFGLLLKEKLEQSGSIKLTLQASKGSYENAELIKNKKVDFSIIQAGINSFDNIDVVTPLFVEPVLILASSNSGIKNISDLTNKNINLGAPGSGSQVTGKRILEHYEIQNYLEHDVYLSEVNKKDIDAIIAVGGLLNKDLKAAVKKYNLHLIGIDDANAISLKHNHLHPFTIPRGVFSENPPVPHTDTTSIASTAILVGKTDIDERLTTLVLEAIYETNLRAHFPLMMTPDEVKHWSLFPLKPASLHFLDPYKGLGLFSNFAEFLVAIKELIVSFFAVSYFIWLAFKRLKTNRFNTEQAELKEKLDSFLDQTILIERQFKLDIEQEELEVLLKKITDIKLGALEELSNEKLRGDGLFAIFMIQCSNLILRMEQHLKTNSQ